MFQPGLAAWAASMAGSRTRINSIATATMAAVRAVVARKLGTCCRMAFETPDPSNLFRGCDRIFSCPREAL
jgi:hypothetical protein